MVTHVVLFTWREHTAAEDVDRVATALDGLVAELAIDLRHGVDLGFRETNADYAVIARFTDRAAWDAYQRDPRHQAFVTEYILPLQASRAAIQFEARTMA